MFRLVSLIVLVSACSIDHTGLQNPADHDAGPAVDGAISDVFDAGMPDIIRPDVPMSDGGPDTPLPTGCERYVSTRGVDTNDGLTQEMPFQSIQAALERTPAVICVEEGVYDLEITIASSLRLRGSFCDGFLLQDFDACSSHIRSPLPWAVLVQGPGRPNVEIESFYIETGDAESMGGSTYGIRVIDSDLTLTNVSIRAKDGADGADGMLGAAGARGDNGRNAGVVSGPGNGGRNCGAGGNGAGVFPPTNGDNAPGAGGGFGLGGSVGSNGGDGTDGASVDTTATPGLGGVGIGSLSTAGFYRPTRGERGDTGAAGFGGGGGGAANGAVTNRRYGGGGGGGGCGGPGGEGGGGGGGSFGIVAISSSVLFNAVRIGLGNGGDGGDGGPGGVGGGGGDGGDGVDLGTSGGDGGDGGSAGAGGLGGGGVGGPSLGIARHNSDLMFAPDVTPGTGGGGGGGGAGAAGVAGVQQTLNLR